jgi:DNA-binding helix-hairpin-helix protein with protein kinase domain
MATTVPLTKFFDSRGNTIRLGKRIGSGGEGDVYELLSAPETTVAKIYKRQLDEKKQEKLRLMARGCNDELEAISAWPTDVLCTRPGGPVVGFLMPRMADAEPVHKVYGPTHRKETFPHADWRFLVRAAKNLAAAFYVIHKFGYVIGDVNEGNILVNDKACVRLIDCDSFQVRSRDEIYCCEVGVAHFTPPEIQQAGNFRHERTANHDNFGLAILIFQLLFLGRHPYAGVYSGREDMPIEKAIAEFRFAYGKNAGRMMMAPPPTSVGPAIVPDRIAELFERAFAEAGTRDSGRPVAGDWWDALDPFEARLRQCTAERVHHYYAGLSSCPWCRLEGESGVLLFLSSDSITKIDLGREWQKVEAITPPGPIPAIGPDNYRLRAAPLVPKIARSLLFRKTRQVAGAALAGGCFLFAAFDVITDPLEVLLVGIIAIVLFFFPGLEAAERKRRWANLETAKYMWRLWSRKWNEEAGEAAFIAQITRLRELRRAYETIERQYQNSLDALEKSVRDRQVSEYLARFPIAESSLSRLGAAPLSALAAAGIITAADATPAGLRRVPRLDPVITGEILSWRDRLEKAFLFDHGRGVNRSEVLALVHRFQPQMRPVESEIQQGTRRLARIQQDIVKKRVILRPQVERRARDLAQATADYRVFESSVEEALRQDFRAIEKRIFSR